MKDKKVRLNIPPEEEKKIREAIDNLEALKSLISNSKKEIALESAIRLSNESDSVDDVIAKAKKIKDYLLTS